MALNLGEYVFEVEVDQFYDWIQQPSDFLLLDVRNDRDFAAWKIESRHTPETLHIPYILFVEEEDQAAALVPKDRDIVVVCAKGGASDFVAEILRERGINAVNLADGMIAWGSHIVQRTLAASDTFRIFQIERPSRGCLSYVLTSRRQAAIIDPLRRADWYLDFLAKQGVQPALILDTHAHADHISGGPELSRISGAPYYLHPYDGIHPFDMLPARLDYHMLADGMEFRLGDLEISTIHTPGHTLGLVNFLVSSADRQPGYLLTGDSLFIRSFGRPDLGGQGRAWAPLVYESIFERIRCRVPETAWVLPGHYARYNEAAPDGAFRMPLRDLFECNQDLHVDKDTFIDYVLAHLPVLPPEYVQIKRVNAGLAHPTELEASELELGKNICALSSAYEAP